VAKEEGRGGEGDQVDWRRNEGLLDRAGSFPVLGRVSNWIREMNLEENERWRFDLNYIFDGWNIVGDVT
jgi:hypothetical protein